VEGGENTECTEERSEVLPTIMFQESMNMNIMTNQKRRGKIE